MMIRGSAVLLFVGGFMLWMMSQFVPLLRLMMMDWVGWFMAIGGIFILLFVFGVSQTGILYDTNPAGTVPIPFIRRDGIIAPLLGKRIFSGESFLDIPRLGLVEDLGIDTVFLWGRKKVRFGLENINYTSDPRYWNMTKELYLLGFDDSEDLRNVLDIPNMDNERDKLKKVYYLERMANVYWKMTHAQPRGVHHLMDIFRKPRPRVAFGKRRNEPYRDAPQKTQPSEQKTTRKQQSMNDVEREVDRWLK